MQEEALIKAIKRFGSQSALARALSVRRNVINNWLNRDKRIPFEYASAIDLLTNGEIDRFELAPYARFLLRLKPIEKAVRQTCNSGHLMERV